MCEGGGVAVWIGFAGVSELGYLSVLLKKWAAWLSEPAHNNGGFICTSVNLSGPHVFTQKKHMLSSIAVCFAIVSDTLRKHSVTHGPDLYVTLWGCDLFVACLFWAAVRKASAP